MLAALGQRPSASLTMMPVRRQTPFPQYVFGTMSPYPMVRNVIEINHMAPRKLLFMSWLSWYLRFRIKAES